MSISQKALNDFMVRLSEEFDIGMDEIIKVAGGIVKTEKLFTLRAKKFADENDVDIESVPHKGEKVTIEDIRVFLGQSTASDAFTAAARVLAKENSLTEDDFPVEGRSGKTRKSGAVEITVGDVRSKMGITKSPKASPVAASLAKDLKVDITQVVGTGKDGRIKKEDIQNFVMNQGGDSDSD
jgi:pyruvate/2-oxoglutarate dehydrogenase complex dihydrolipoamide acyltransferase (E2) component